MSIILSNHINSFWWYALKMYKNYFMYNWDMYSDLVKHKEERRSAIVSPTTHAYMNSTYNMLLDNITTVDMRTTNNDTDDSFDKEFLNEVIEIFIPYMEEKEGFNEAMHSSFFDTTLLWCSPVWVGWTSVDKESKYISKATGSIETIQLKQSNPIWEYIWPFDNCFYWSKTNYDKRNFIRRKLITKSTIKNMIKLWRKYLIPDDNEAVNIQRVMTTLNSATLFYHSTADFDSIKNHMAFIWNQNSFGSWSTKFNQTFFWGNGSHLYSITDDDGYSIKDKMVEIIELDCDMGTKIYIAWEFLGIMPYSIPINGSQKLNMKFKEIPWSFQWLGIGTVAAPIQKAFDDILNPRIDAVIMSASPMYIQNSTWSLFANKKTIKTRPWEVLQSNDPRNALFPVPIQEVGGSAYRETDALMAMGNSMTGISNLSLGMQQKVERVSWSVSLLKASTDNSLNPLMNSIKATRWWFLKRALILCKTSWGKEEVDKVFWPDSKFSKISLNKLVNNYDFIYSMTSEALESKTADITQLMKILDFVASQEQNGKKVDISSEKLSEIILNKLNIAYGDLSQEATDTVMNMSGDVWLATDTVKAATGLNDRSIEKWMREMQGTGVGDIPPEMTTNSQWINSI